MKSSPFWIKHWLTWIILLPLASSSLRAGELSLPEGNTLRIDYSDDLMAAAQIWVPDSFETFVPWEQELDLFQTPDSWEDLFDGQDRPELIWVKVQLSTEEKEEAQDWLVAWNTYEAWMYFPSSNGLDSLRNGNFVPASRRALGINYGAIPFFPVRVNPGEPLTLYFKIRPGKVRVHDRLEWAHGRIMSSVHYVKYDQIHRLLDSLVLGIILAVALYNLVIFFFTQRKEYLLLALFSTAMLFFLMNLRDYTLGAFWPEWPRWNYTGFTMSIGLLMFLMFVLFTQAFLGTKQYVPLRHRFLNILLLINLVFIAFRLVAEWQIPDWHARNHPLMASLLRLIWLSIVLGSVWAAVGCYQHRPKAVRRYLLINAVLIVLALLRLLSSNDLIPIPIPFDAITFTIALQQISFALALADHIGQIKTDMLQAEKNAAINATQNRLYANLTHEFRTPLTLITGLSNRLQAGDKVRVKEKLSMIEQNGFQLLDLVNQMLDLSKLEAGHLSLKPRLGNLAHYLESIVASFQPLAEEKDIRLNFVSDPSSIEMDFDPSRIQQITSNLLSNAIKFTPEGGKISVLARAEGSRFYLSVEDTGPGIAPAHLPHIFERYFQITDTQQTQRGTGIGLALVKELVQLMEGEIAVSSELNKGTRFNLQLPIRRSASKDEGTEAEAHWPMVRPRVREETSMARPMLSNSMARVLIVEDNPDLRFFLRTCLSEQFELYEAKNGLDGLRQAQELVPDLIVSDLMMPEMDGYQMLQALRKEQLTVHIPVIILTAKADEETRLQGFREGADAFLPKPFQPEELLLRIERILDVRGQLQARLSQITASEAETEPEDPSEAFMYHLRKLIESRMDDEELDTTALAKELGMSRANLHRKVKQLTNEAPGRYLKRLRMERAQHQLLHTQLNINEIAYKVGYADPAYFTRVYRDHFNQTPSQTRNPGS